MDEIRERLLVGLRDAAAGRLGAGHACVRALDAAAQDGGTAALRSAQEALGALEPALQAEIMAATHRAMRLDPTAITALWRPRGPMS